MLPTVGTSYKFDYDGQALRYPGNSIVSHVPQDTSTQLEKIYTGTISPC
ncbi:DUF1868 domain-containing protein [Rodentibacter caecimuris]|nr:DUF1868 domain-containing protein [Rodentibacter heylii]